MINKNQSQLAHYMTVRASKSNHSQRFSQIKLLTGRLRSIKQLSLSKFKKNARNSDSLAQSFRSEVNNKLIKVETNCSIGGQKEKQKQNKIQITLREGNRKKKMLPKPRQNKTLIQNISKQKKLSEQYLENNNEIKDFKQNFKSSKSMIKQKFRKIKQSSTSLWNLQSNKQFSINETQTKSKSPINNNKLLKKQIHEFQLLEQKLKQILQNTEIQKNRYNALISLINHIGKQQQEQEKISSQKILTTPYFSTQIEDIFINQDNQQKNISLNQRSHKKLLKFKQFQIQSLQKQVHLIIKATNQNFAKLRKSKEEVLACRKERVMFSCFNKNIQKQIKKQETQYMKLLIDNKNKLSFGSSIQTNDLVQKIKTIFKKHHQEQKTPKSSKVIRQQSNNTNCFVQKQLQIQEASKNNCMSFYAQNKKKVMINLRSKTKDSFKRSLQQRYQQLKNQIQYYQNITHKIYNTFGVRHICYQENLHSKTSKQFEILDSLDKQNDYENKQYKNYQQMELFQTKQQEIESNILRIRQKIINLSSKNNIIVEKLKKYDDLIFNYQQKRIQEIQNQVKFRAKRLYQDQQYQENYKEELKFNSIKEFSEIISEIKKLLPKSQTQNKKEEVNLNSCFQNKILFKIEQVVQTYNYAKIKQDSNVSIQNIKKMQKKLNFKLSLQTPQSQFEPDQNSLENSTNANVENYNKKFNTITNLSQKKNTKNGEAYQNSPSNFIQLNFLNKQRSSIQSKPISQLMSSISAYQNSDKILNRRQFQIQYLKMIQKNQKKKKAPLIKKPIFFIY